MQPYRKLDPGQARENIYRLLESWGLELDEDRHVQLRMLLKEHANAKNVEIIKRLEKAQHKLDTLSD